MSVRIVKTCGSAYTLAVKMRICCCGGSPGALGHEFHVELQLGLRTRSKKKYIHTYCACVQGAWMQMTRANWHGEHSHAK